MITKPKGTNDIIKEEAKIWKYIEDVVDSIMEKYNYSYIRTPIFESTELFHRGIGSSTDIVTKETYDFKDRGDRSLTLRPEGTAGVVRSYIENKMYGDPNQPVKLYYNGTMYRYERPQTGRDRELTQFGVEVLGTNDPLSDAEVISLAVNTYKLLGIEDTVVEINSLGDDESRKNYKEALIKYLEPHIDELCEDCKVRLKKNPLRILDCKIDGEKEILNNAPSTIEYLNEESKKRFDKVLEFLDIMEIKYKVNKNIVRGLDYYNHTVFEIKTDIENIGNAQTLGAGGRYNNLVKELSGPQTDCIGFASGIGRVVLALKAKEIKVPIKNDLDVFIMYLNDEEKKYATYLMQELRLRSFTTDTDFKMRSIKSQFKIAERLNSKFVIILNSEELNEGVVKVKNLKTKEEELVSLEYLIYYLDEKINIDEEIDFDINNLEKELKIENACTCNDDCKNDCTCDEENCNCHDQNN